MFRKLVLDKLEEVGAKLSSEGAIEDGHVLSVSVPESIRDLSKDPKLISVVRDFLVNLVAAKITTGAAIPAQDEARKRWVEVLRAMNNHDQPSIGLSDLASSCDMTEQKILGIVNRQFPEILGTKGTPQDRKVEATELLGVLMEKVSAVTRTE